MKSILKVNTTIIIIFISTFLAAQTPQTPIINWAIQEFPSPSTATTNNNYQLKVSQNISPRVIRPVKAGATEKVKIMFLGNWLDLTDEVVITGPGVTSPRGVTAGSITKANGLYLLNGAAKPIIQNYIGVYAIVEFYVTNDAAEGTHTVRLRRPRLGPGKDETVFYIEVYKLPRIHRIKIEVGSVAESSQANIGRVAYFTIDGENLRQMQTIGTCNGLIEILNTPSISDTKIKFQARCKKAGILDALTILTTSFPANYKYAEYPEQMTSESHQSHRFTIKAP